MVDDASPSTDEALTAPRGFLRMIPHGTRVEITFSYGIDMSTIGVSDPSRYHVHYRVFVSREQDWSGWAGDDEEAAAEVRRVLAMLFPGGASS